MRSALEVAWQVVQSWGRIREDQVLRWAELMRAVHAFEANGRQSHTWSYPEEAIRNYVRNCAEATERRVCTDDEVEPAGMLEPAMERTAGIAWMQNAASIG